MPGREVKDWAKYEALRRKGYSKESAARIANSQAGGGMRGVLRNERERRRGQGRQKRGSR